MKLFLKLFHIQDMFYKSGYMLDIVGLCCLGCYWVYELQKQTSHGFS